MRFCLSGCVAVLVVSVGGAIAAADQPGEPVRKILDDGRVVVDYGGGTYIGEGIVDPGSGAFTWHGPCVFHFKTGAVFEGSCANGRFARGFLRSVDGRSVKFLDIERSDDEAARLTREGQGL